MNLFLSGKCSRNTLSLRSQVNALLVLILALWIPAAVADNSPAQSIISGNVILSSATEKSPQVFAIGHADNQLVQSENGNVSSTYSLSNSEHIALVAWDINADGFAEPIVVNSDSLEYLIAENDSISSQGITSYDLSQYFSNIDSAVVVDTNSDGIQELVLGGIDATAPFIAIAKASALGPVMSAFTQSQQPFDFLTKLNAEDSEVGFAAAASSFGEVSLISLSHEGNLQISPIADTDSPITAMGAGQLSGSNETDIILAGATKLFTVIDVAHSNPQVIEQQLSDTFAPTSLALVRINGNQSFDLAITTGNTPGLSALWIFKNDSGVYELVQSFTPGGIPSGVTAFDLDGDNDTDLVFSDRINNYIYALEHTQSENPMTNFQFRGDLSGPAAQSASLPLALRLGGIVGVKIFLDDLNVGYSDAHGQYSLSVPYGQTNIHADKADFAFLRQHHMALQSARYRIDFLAAVGDEPPFVDPDDESEDTDNSTPDDGSDSNDFVPPKMPDVPIGDSTSGIDTDADGVSDLQEMLDGSNPFDAGSFRPNPLAPRYAFWNTFLGQRNIVETANTHDSAIDVLLNTFGVAGSVLRSLKTITLQSNTQRDFIADDSLNQRPAYGVVSLEASDSPTGRLMRYRYNDAGQIQSAVVSPFRPVMRGSSAVTFNTFHPDTPAGSEQAPVANWLSLASFSDKPEQFTIEAYEQNGNLLDSNTIELAPFERIDIDGGHRFGPGSIGLLAVVPQDTQAPYLAELFRHASSGNSGEADIGLNIPTHAGNGEAQYLILDQLSASTAWLETANVSETTVSIVVNFLDPTGAVIDSLEADLPAKAQRHLDVSQFSAGHETVLVQIMTNSASSIVANCISYSKTSPTTTWATSVLTAREVFGQQLSSSYNRFSNAQNTLFLANTARVSVQITLNVNDQSIEMELAPFASTSVPLSNDVFSIEQDSYGLVSVNASLPGTIIGNILRNQEGTFAVRIPLS